jgi:hypothetical protein
VESIVDLGTLLSMIFLVIVVFVLLRLDFVV